jgi:putative endonuclease
VTKDERLARGLIGEQAAAEYYRREGYRVVETNWRCRIGEIDIIAERDGILVIAEVRTRSGRTLGAFGTPLESITPKKQLTLRRCAEAYLQRRGAAAPAHVRFDCVGVVLNERDEPKDITLLPDAF